jgi:hypothetical protein
MYLYLEFYHAHDLERVFPEKQRKKWVMYILPIEIIFSGYIHGFLSM